MATKNIYNEQLITRNIRLSINEIGRNIKEVLELKLSNQLENKCINEGFVRENSVNIESYSSGLIDGEFINFITVIKLEICNPVENMILKCKVKDITKAGIRAHLDMKISPLVIFIARDHNNLNEDFHNVEIGDSINVNIIGTRFELNDEFISVIAELTK